MTTKDLLKKHFEELTVLKAARRAKAQPFKDEREKLVQQQQELQKKIDSLTVQVNAALGDDFLKLSKELSSTAKALGAVSMTETR